MRERDVTQKPSGFYKTFVWVQDHFAKVFWTYILSVSALYLVTGSKELFVYLLAAPVVALIALGAAAFASAMIVGFFTRFLR